MKKKVRECSVVDLAHSDSLDNVEMHKSFGYITA